jgi:dolichol-phosphate mannosyltransferase
MSNSKELSGVVLVVPVLDEEDRIARVVRRVPRPPVDEVLVVDDGSRDSSAARARDAGAEVLSLPRTVGVGAAIRAGLDWARERRFEIACVAAGNDKDAPEELGRLIETIRLGFDFVQGSRYLPGGNHGGMPRYRKLATRVHPFLFSLALRRRISDSTNGFRAFRLALLDDPKIRLEQEWLDGYELEPYLYFRAIKLRYRVCEVPVTKIYPARGLPYTKMKPIIGWWQMLRPIFYLGLGFRS